MSQRETFTPDKKLLIKNYVILALVVVFFILPGEAMVFIPDVGWVFALVYTIVNLLWIVPLAVAMPFHFRTIEYELAEDEIVVRRGLITKTETTVPYRTVTNVDVKRGPLDRVFGLGSIKIHTAGYSQQTNAEATLSGLADYAQRHELLRTSLRRYRARTGASIGAEELPSAAEGAADSQALLGEILSELRVIRQHLER